jgi:NAD(P)-dependent dehydrogenase (short-subunit alcohol dehydrogenase family)
MKGSINMRKREIDFTDKVVVITGAGGIICGKLAEEFAAAGAKVALLNRTKSKAEAYVERIEANGGIGKAYEVDVTDKNKLEKVRQEVRADFGPTDILINGAGGNNPQGTTDNEHHTLDLDKETKTFFDLEQAAIEKVFDVNFLGTLLTTQVFAQDMVDREGANIINISSMNAFTPLTKIPAYSGAKAAVSNLTQWLAVHFSKVGIRCNAIAPGFLVSDQNRDLMLNEDGTPKERGEKILNSTPMGRFGEPEELVGGVFFLANEELASFVNGVVLPIDGGFNAYSGV